MPYDHPDYFGQGIFPKYGGLRRIYNQLNVTANAETEIVSITGKGMLSYIYIDSTSSGSQRTDLVRLYVDGLLTKQKEFLGMLGYGDIKPKSGDFYLLAYNETQYIYSMELAGVLPFESSVSLRYVENNGRTPAVFGEISYYLVT